MNTLGQDCTKHEATPSRTECGRHSQSLFFTASSISTNNAGRDRSSSSTSALAGEISGLCFIGEREALAELQLRQDFLADLETWTVYPALLDLATGSALYLIRNYQESSALYFPVSYKRITLYHPLPSTFWSHIRSHQEYTTRSEVVTFDVTLLDGRGKVVADIEEFTLRRMANRFQSLPQCFVHKTLRLTARSRIGCQSGDVIHRWDQGIRPDLICEPIPSVVVTRGEFATRPTMSPAVDTPASSTTDPRDGVESVLPNGGRNFWV